MTIAELEREAAAIVPPVGAGALCLVTDEQRHRVAFVINGRGKAPVGPGFAKPREAARFMDLLAGERPAPRPGQTTVRQDPPPGSDVVSSDAASAGTPSISSAGPTGAPELDTRASGTPVRSHGPVAAASTEGAAVMPPVLCAGCGDPVPSGRHGQRRLTHGPACRQAARRRRQAEAARADVDSGSADVTPSRPSTDPLHNEALGASSSARPGLRGAAHPASGVSRARGATSPGSAVTG